LGLRRFGVGGSEDEEDEEEGLGVLTFRTRLVGFLARFFGGGGSELASDSSSSMGGTMDRGVGAGGVRGVGAATGGVGVGMATSTTSATSAVGAVDSTTVAGFFLFRAPFGLPAFLGVSI